MLSTSRVIVLALGLLGGADAFFRINCATINRGRIDPLVNPGALAAHSHTIVGSASTYSESRVEEESLLTHV